MRLLRRVCLALSALVVTVLFAVLPAVSASAHSLSSSTIAVRLTDDSAEATVSVALETIDAVLGTSYAKTETLTDGDVSAIVQYINEHLTAAGANGATWSETYSGALLETVEGIRSFSVDVAFGTEGDDTSSMVLSYDAVIDADATHEAVVVLTDADGAISTAGVITATDETLVVGDQVQPGLMDMIGLGFHHVLEGADHLLFLITLLLVAPLGIAAGRRWTTGTTFTRSLRQVIGVVTAFTVGHSLTLLASALGWISLPTTLVEVLVAASVAIAAIHAIRPLARRGEVIIAGAFGLVHGLAFAGILADLGYGGGLSLLTLLAFNVGVELAQLLTVLLIYPSLYAISRTRWGTGFRVAVATVALVAAGLWVADRWGVVADPLAGIEEAVIAQSWLVAAGLALVAVVASLTGRAKPPGRGRRVEDGDGGGVERRPTEIPKARSSVG